MQPPRQDRSHRELVRAHSAHGLERLRPARPKPRGPGSLSESSCSLDHRQFKHLVHRSPEAPASSGRWALLLRLLFGRTKDASALGQTSERNASHQSLQPTYCHERPQPRSASGPRALTLSTTATIPTLPLQRACTGGSIRPSTTAPSSRCRHPQPQTDAQLASCDPTVTTTASSTREPPSIPDEPCAGLFSRCAERVGVATSALVVGSDRLTSQPPRPNQKPIPHTAHQRGGFPNSRARSTDGDRPTDPRWRSDRPSGQHLVPEFCHSDPLLDMRSHAGSAY